MATAGSDPVELQLSSLLDGSRSLEEICGKLLLEGFPTDSIVGSLQKLHEMGALAELEGSPASLLLPVEIERYRLQMRLLETCRAAQNDIPQSRSAWEEAGGPPQAALKAASVAVVGAGVIGSNLLRFLTLAGIGRLDAISTSGDIDAIEQGAWSGIGGLRSAIAKLNPGLEFREVELKEFLSMPFPSSANLMVYCADRCDEDLCQHLNALALRCGIPTLFVRQQLFEFEIGPLVLPGETACYVCYQRRRAGVLSKLDLTHPIETRHAPRPNFPFGTGWLATEIIKFISGVAEPISRGRLWRLDFLVGLPSVHSVLKLPRCPACGIHKHNPPRKLWEELT